MSSFVSAAGLVDIANGMTVRADPGRVAFPNIGLTSSVLHDECGPVGTLSQALTARPG